MCLAIPGKLIEIYEEAGMKMGKIDYSGAINKACLEYVPEIEIGQYTVVHAGFAISIINEEDSNLQPCAENRDALLYRLSTGGLVLWGDGRL